MHLRSLLFLLAPLALAATAAAQTPLRWHGAEFLLPEGWRTEATDEVTLLLPAGWSRDVETGEAYGLLFDEEIKELDSEDLAETIDGAAGELVAGAERSGAIAKGKLGSFESRTLTYATRNAAGKAVEIRFHVFMTKDGAGALFALGYPDKLQSRQKELQALCDSLAAEGAARPRKRAFGLGKKDDGKAADPAAPKPEAGGAEPAKPATEQPAFKRIDGGRELQWNGIAIDVAKGWRTENGEQGTQLLLPPGFGASGVIEELCALCGDGSLRSLAADDAAQKIQQGVDEVQPGLQLRGAPKAARFGALSGKTFVFTGTNDGGQQVEAQVHAFDMAGGVRAFLALGFPEKLRARSTDIAAMLGSMRPLAGKAAAGNVPAELAGQWQYMANVNANNGGGRASQSFLNLGADGTYTYSGETVSTNPEGAAWGNTRDAGTWSVEGTTMTFRSQDGSVTSYALEKRNHPKNRDPMIVLDGKAFVTSTQRAPW